MSVYNRLIRGDVRSRTTVRHEEWKTVRSDWARRRMEWRGAWRCGGVLESMNNPSKMVHLPAVLVDIAPLIAGTKEPRTGASGVGSVESTVISVTREGIVAPAPGIAVGVIMLVMLGTI